jgi:sec-independent protein translocase protein TatB
MMSFSETIFLFVIALMVFGPKKLPEIARQIGKALNEFKRASNEFKAQIEAEVQELEYQERDRKRKEEEQKMLPPAAPPTGVVESSTLTSRSGPIVENSNPVEPVTPAADANSTPQQTTHA